MAKVHPALFEALEPEIQSNRIIEKIKYAGW